MHIHRWLKNHKYIARLRKHILLLATNLKHKAKNHSKHNSQAQCTTNGRRHNQDKAPSKRLLLPPFPANEKLGIFLVAGRQKSTVCMAVTSSVALQLRHDQVKEAPLFVVMGGRYNKWNYICSSCAILHIPSLNSNECFYSCDSSNHADYVEKNVRTSSQKSVEVCPNTIQS